MGLTLTLTDNEIPASPAFIEFLHATLTGTSYHVGEWFSQEGEGLAFDHGRYDNIQEKARFVLGSEDGKALVIRSYRFFKEMLTGKPNTLNDMKQYHFFFVVGIPRTGGTYLTKQLFRAIGLDYTKIQNSLAHDGFPHLAQLDFNKGGNVHTNGLLQLAEYLTMVEVFYGRNKHVLYEGKAIVPKKFTKAVYNAPLIRELFDSNAHFLITLRHPLPFIQSVLDKSGGWPEGKGFATRSAIERWALEAWLNYGHAEADICALPYLEVMLGYWKRFHYQLALSGLAGLPNTKLIPYGREPMTETARQLFRGFGVNIQPEAFKDAEPGAFSLQEREKAAEALHEVHHFWESLGLAFPAAALAAGY